MCASEFLHEVRMFDNMRLDNTANVCTLQETLFVSASDKYED